MQITPTQLRISDHQSDGLNSTTDYNRPLPLIHDYNLSYNDTDYGIDPYWDIQIYNQHDLQFNETFKKPEVEIEPNCPMFDRALNNVLTKALVDTCQTSTGWPRTRILQIPTTSFSDYSRRSTIREHAGHQ